MYVNAVETTVSLLEAANSTINNLDII